MEALNRRAVPYHSSPVPVKPRSYYLPSAVAAMPPAGSLTAEQLSFFDSNGYLVLESFSSAEEVLAMRGRLAELVDWFDDANSTVFSSKDHRQVKDDYFFKSAENISFFFEEKAFGDDGCLKQPKELSINKVGHGLMHYMNLTPCSKSFLSRRVFLACSLL